METQKRDKMSEFASSETAIPETPKNRKISKEVLQEYQEQVKTKKKIILKFTLRLLLSIEGYEFITTGDFS